MTEQKYTPAQVDMFQAVKAFAFKKYQARYCPHFNQYEIRREYLYATDENDARRQLEACDARDIEITEVMQ